MSLEWGLYRCLENSLKDALDKAISDELITDLNDVAIPIYIKGQRKSDWTVPNITIGVESETSVRFEIGSNNRDDKQLIICDIFAQDEGQRIDLACWLKDFLSDGWMYKTYKPNSSTPTEITYEDGGWVEVNFLSNARVNLGENAGELDQHRHRITINVVVSSS